MQMHIQVLPQQFVARINELTTEFERQIELGIVSHKFGKRFARAVNHACESHAVGSLNSPSTAGLIMTCDLKRIGNILKENASRCQSLVANVDKIVEKAVAFAREEQLSEEGERALVEELMSSKSVADAERLLGLRKREATQRKLDAFMASIKTKASQQDSSHTEASDATAPQETNCEQCSHAKSRREQAASETVCPAARKLYERGMRATSRKERIRLFGEAISAEHQFQRSLVVGKTHKHAHHASA